MFLRGVCWSVEREKVVAYELLFFAGRNWREVVVREGGKVRSAYKNDDKVKYMAYSAFAQELCVKIEAALALIKKKGIEDVDYNGRIAQKFYKKTRAIEMSVLSDGHTTYKIDINTEKQRILSLEIMIDADDNEIRQKPPAGIPYVALSAPEMLESGREIVVRSVDEIKMYKPNTGWLDTVKGIVIRNDEDAERFFTALEAYDGIIAYDTETTGLRINCFGKINSSYARELEAYNAVNTPIKVDRLCGLVFAVNDKKGYYLPCFSRKFGVLYENDTEIKRKLVEKIRMRYTVGDLRDREGDIADLVRSGAELSPDVILMERARDILEKKNLVAFNAAFEHKVGFLYDIVTNIKEDPMLLHQFLYRFGSDPRHRRSALKYLIELEFGIETWTLQDFFPDFDETEEARIRHESTAGKRAKKKKGANIDFSYMNLDGVEIYAPADGYFTIRIFRKYSDALNSTEHSEKTTIYRVEVEVTRAVAYTEFYGHRFDVEKLRNLRQDYREYVTMMESKIRHTAGISQPDEDEVREKLEIARDENNLEQAAALSLELQALLGRDSFNMGSSKQVCDLFYHKLGLPQTTKKGLSAAKDAIAGLVALKNEDDTDKYPIARQFQSYKAAETLLKMFFDNLGDFMYPGGFIFSSYGQYSAATGRMTCTKPNAQQYPKTLAAAVIARPGCIVMDADFMQIEYRVIVALSKEPSLMAAFFDPDNDYHTVMAALMYGVPYEAVTPDMRTAAKRLNFGIPYGMGDGALALLLFGSNTPKTREMAKEMRKLYFKDQPLVEAFFQRVREAAIVHGFTQTYWKRRRSYDFSTADRDKANMLKAMAERQAGNAVVQGCLHGDSRILTREYGYVKIRDVVNKNCQVWDGDAYVDGWIADSGLKAEYVVTLTCGTEIRCSGGHKFWAAMSDGRFRWVEAYKLRNYHYIRLGGPAKRWKAESVTNARDDIYTLGTEIPAKAWAWRSCLRRYLRLLYVEHGKLTKNGISFEILPSLEFTKDVQQALLLFGVPSRIIGDDELRITGKYVANFREKIGVIDGCDEMEMYQTLGASKTFGGMVTRVAGVRETGQEVPMFDVMNSASGKFMANGLVTHNTAADIFKIAIARCMRFILKNNLLGKVFLTNMIHDELLFEIDVTKLDALVATAGLVKAMRFPLDGFPPLYVGAGVSNTWESAKSKDAEIHPVLMDTMKSEAVLEMLHVPTKDAAEWIAWFKERVDNFRRDKIAAYLMDESNFGRNIHPEIGNLMRLQYLRYVNTSDLTGKGPEIDAEKTLRCVDFMAENYGIDVSRDNFRATGLVALSDDEKEYSDEDTDDDEADFTASMFEVLEDNLDMGLSILDLIREFGYFVSLKLKLCGIDMDVLDEKRKMDVISYLMNEKACEEDDEDALQVVLHLGAGVLKYTTLYVRDLGMGEGIEAAAEGAM
jgi:DNA polymerase I-like protein with 3'-5' exonuclease and polymerase domains